jgi:hypothetical protein
LLNFPNKKNSTDRKEDVVCLKNTHTHTIDIHVKKREPNKVTKNITNNTKKKRTKQAHIGERERERESDNPNEQKK